MSAIITQKSNASSEGSQQRIEESAAPVNTPLRNTSNQEARRILSTAITISFQPHLKMQLPTTIELWTAIEVLDKLGKRLEAETAHSIQQLPETTIGNEYAVKMAARNAERITRIEAVKSQLENGSQELNQGRRQCVSNHVSWRQ